MRTIRVVIEIRVPDQSVISDSDLDAAVQKVLFENEPTFREALFGEPARKADYLGPKVKRWSK